MSLEEELKQINEILKTNLIRQVKIKFEKRKIIILNILNNGNSKR